MIFVVTMLTLCFVRLFVCLLVMCVCQWQRFVLFVYTCTGYSFLVENKNYKICSVTYL